MKALYGARVVCTKTPLISYGIRNWVSPVNKNNKTSCDNDLYKNKKEVDFLLEVVLEIKEIFPSLSIFPIKL